MGVGDRAVLIENVMGGDVDTAAGAGPDAVRAAWGLTADAAARALHRHVRGSTRASTCCSTAASA